MLNGFCLRMYVRRYKSDGVFFVTVMQSSDKMEIFTKVNTHERINRIRQFVS